MSDTTSRKVRDEEGMIHLGLLLICSLFVTFVLVGIAGLAIATTSSQSNQNAADAAAIAGAEAFEQAGAHYFAPGFSGSGELRGKVMVSGACPAQVRAAAAHYASRNGSQLAGCRMVKWGELQVTLTRDTPLKGNEKARSTARASWDLTWDRCNVDPSFVAPITGSAVTWMQCGSDRFVLKYAGGRYFLHPWGQVKQAITPRLIG
ncbi:hypothetical protein [Ornithinimicrobium sp. Y1694]|uniref:hypothetical protein n=1 Tax=Ornithinimicrobium sp. Y1694 TaxID=3418590 RepID=UPI003CEE2F0B